MSSAEAEFYALVEGTVKAMGLASCARELGLDPRIRLWTDSSSAKSFVSRRGLGIIRHTDTKWLWMQEAVSRKQVEVNKIDGKVNPADALTKHLSYPDVRGKLSRLNLVLGTTCVEGGVDPPRS